MILALTIKTFRCHILTRLTQQAKNINIQNHAFVDLRHISNLSISKVVSTFDIVCTYDISKKR